MIDIVFSSCARVGLLDKTVKSFNEKVSCNVLSKKTLVEDWVEDKTRREEGLEWIKANGENFHNIVILDETVGPYLQFQEAAKQTTYDYLFKMDDDAEFVLPVEIDKMVEIMDEIPELSQLILRRPNHREINPVVVAVSGQFLTMTDFFSISYGLHRMRHVRKLFDDIGWKTEAHETSVLTPAAKRLGLKCGIYGDGEVHYRHVGGELGFNKGAWK